MAKRKLSTGGNIYFTLDNYGRRKAHKFGDGGPTMEAADFDTSGGGLKGMDMSGLVPLAINSGSYVKKSEQGQSGGSPALKALSDMTSAFKQYSETVNSSPDFKPQVDYLAINRESQSDPIGMSADMTGQLIEGIANLKQGERVPLSEKIGLTNHHGKYIRANGGQLRSRRVANKFEEGGGADIGGGGAAEKYLGVAATAGALTGNAFNQAQTADTRVLEEDIKDTGNMQVSASSNDDLMNAWGQRQQLNHVSWKDVWGKNIGQAVGNTFSASGQGFSAGSSFGPWGAAIGGVVGGVSSLIGSLVGRRRAKKKAKKLNKAIDAANERQTVTLENATSNVDTNNDLTAMRNYAALGGPLSMYSPYAFGVQGPLEYALMQEDLDIKQQRADNAGESSSSGLTFGKGGGIHINPKNKGKLTATSKRTGKSFSELAHSKNPLTRKRAIFALNARKWHHGKKHAFGGDLESNGANWDLGFTSIGNGGTHEMNPYEGVQMGMDSKGIPNLVEQGEIVYNDYVFSNRLTATPSLLQAYNLPKKYRGLTFSEMADKISGEVKERPNDPISQKDFENNMQRLVLAQEAVRQAQQQQQAIQQAALMQQAQQYAAQQQQLAQQQAYQNALAQQAYNNQQLGAMQGMVSPEEPQQFAKGGFKARRQARLDAIEEAKANGTYVSSREKWNAPAWQSEPDEYQQESYGMQGMRQRRADRLREKISAMEDAGKDFSYDRQGRPQYSARYNRLQNKLSRTLALLNPEDITPEEYGCGGGLKFARGGNLYGFGTWFKNKPINSSVKSYKNWEDWFGSELPRTINSTDFETEEFQPVWATTPFTYNVYTDSEGKVHKVSDYFGADYDTSTANDDYLAEDYAEPTWWNRLAETKGWTANQQGEIDNPDYKDWVNEFTKEDSTLDYDQVSRMLELAQSGNTDAQKWLGDNFPGMTQSQWAAITAAQNKAPIYSTMGRNAPIYGDIAAGLINGIWGNKQDYANKIQAAADAARVPERVQWNPLGDYVPPSYFDTQYALNQLNSQFGATNRAAINNANGNRATAMANLLASQHNYGNQVGGLYRQAQEYNANEERWRAEFNEKTNLANSEGFLKAAMANQAERRAGLNSALQGTVYAQNMGRDTYYDWLSNMTKGIGNFMGDIGAKAKENMAFNMVNSGKGNMYFNTADGVMGYLGSPYNNTQLAQRARGGYLTIPDRQIRRRRR